MAPRHHGSVSVARWNTRLALAFFALYFLARVPTVVDPDLFHGLSLARAILTERKVPLADRFAYTPTRFPVVHHEWLTATVFYLVATRGGAQGFLVLKYALAFAAAAGALAVASAEGASIATLAFLVPLGLNMAAPGMTTIRAQVVTLVFTVVVLWMIAADRRGRRGWVFAYLLLHVVWLNVHAGFVVGLGLLATHAVEQTFRGRPLRHVLAALVAALVLVTVNPYGVAYYAYVFEALRMDRSLIVEWQPLWSSSGGMVAWSVSLVVLAYVVWKLGWRAASGWLIVLVTAALALRSQRNLSIYGLVWLTQVPPLVELSALGRVLGRLWTTRPARTAAVLLLACGWALVGAVERRPWQLHFPTRPGPQETIVYPLGAVAYLEAQNFHGNLMVPFAWGAFVSWKLYPAVKVSIDGRYEVAYAPSLLVEHEDFYRHRTGWRAMLARYPTDLVLVPKGVPIEPAMRTESGWRLVYEDDAATLWVRPDLPLPYTDRRGASIRAAFP